MTTINNKTKNIQITQFMIDMVHAIYGKLPTYERYRTAMNYEFCQSYTLEEVVAYFEPTINDEVIDLTLLHEHTTGLSPN